MTLLLLAAALLLGGLRNPVLFAVGGAVVWGVAWIQRPKLGPAAAWLPWICWALLSALLGASPFSAAPVLARWFAALGFLSLASVWTERERECWVLLMMFAGIILALAAVWTGAKTHFAPGSMTGLIPPYYNYTAFVLSAAGSAAAAWALHPKGPRGVIRVGSLVFSVAAALCVGVSHSRGGIFGFSAAALFWSWRRWGLRGLATFLSGGLIAVILAFSSPAIHARAFKTTRVRGEARPRIWSSAIAVASDSLLGEGLGNFGAGFRRHLVAVPGAAALGGLSTDYAHSELLQVAAETGWLGFCLWLAALLFGLRGLRGGLNPEPAREAGAIAIASMAAQILVDNMLQIPGLVFLFFSAVAVAGALPISLGVAPLPSVGGASPGGRRPWPKWAILVGAALALGAWIPRALADGHPARAAVLFPTDAYAFEDLAYRAQAQGKISEADGLWARAAQLSPFDAVYPWRRAQLAFARGDWGKAERLSARAIAVEPGFLRARLLRTAALARLGRTLEVRAELAEIRTCLAKPLAGSAENGYEHAVSDFDLLDRGELARLEAGVKPQGTRR